MDIYEFDAPLFVTPSRDYWIKELNMILVPTSTPTPYSEYWRPKTVTKVIIYDHPDAEVKSVLKALVIFSNFVHQNYPVHTWFQERAFSDFTKYRRTISNLEDYLKGITERQNWYLSVDFNEYPLSEVTSDPLRINFGEKFMKYFKLKPDNNIESEVKSLIDFYSYNSVVQIIANKIYNNVNFYISCSFIILESLIRLEINDIYEDILCPSCGNKISSYKSMIKLVQNYVKSKTDDTDVQEIIISILRQHYIVRNRFFHAAKYEDNIMRTDSLITSLGRSHFTLEDDIRYTNASIIGIRILDSFLRRELLQYLDKF